MLAGKGSALGTTLAIDAGTRTTLLDETIGANLRSTVARFGTDEALVSRHQGVRYSYEELWNEVEEVARGLVALGIQRGDRVGIWAPNCAEWTLTQFATARIGAILVNVNPAYRPAELVYALRQSGVRMLVLAERFKASEYLEMLASVRAELVDLERTITIGSERAGRTEDLVWSELREAASASSASALEAREATLDP